MWRCNKCSQEVDEDFEVCWNCETVREGAMGEDTQAVSGSQDTERLTSPLFACLRCGSSINYLGSRSFRDESQWGALNALKHVLANHNFDVFSCVDCGQIELFMPDIAADRRPQ